MMAAQEIIELFCELIAVRLPIIEAQRYRALHRTIILASDSTVNAFRAQ